MVEQHYRWDFIGLSTDTKPTPETSERVVNGSTYYTADDSKLYVFCDGEWYERQPLGGGGGGGGEGGIPELTEADYNYPADNPTRIAAWLLDDGVYHFTTGVNVVLDNESSSFNKGGGILLKNTYLSRIEMTLLTDSSSSNNRGFFNLLTEVVSEYGTRQEDPAYNITSRQTVDRLNDTSTYYPLSANQGKILNDKITALEARVAALEG